MAGFFYRKHMLGLTTGATDVKIIANSQTITIGDAVKMASGFATLALNTGIVYGVVVGLVDNQGLNLTSSKADYDGTVSGDGDTLTYVATSDNQTDHMIKAIICVDPFVLWYNDADGSLTNAMEGTFFDTVAASDQISASSTSGTSGSFQLVSRDPDGDADASKGLFRIAESQLWAYAQQ